MNATNITKTLENIFESTRDDKRPLRGNKISNISFQATSTPSNSILEIPARNKLLTGKKNILRGFEERKPTHDVNTEPREQDYRNAPIVKILKSDNIVKSKMRKEQKRLKEKHKVDDDVILLDDISSDETTKKVVISHNPEEKTIKNLVVPQPRVSTRKKTGDVKNVKSKPETNTKLVDFKPLLNKGKQDTKLKEVNTKHLASNIRAEPIGIITSRTIAEKSEVVAKNKELVSSKKEKEEPKKICSNTTEIEHLTQKNKDRGFKTANLKIFKSDHNALLKRPSSSHSANVRLKNSEINSEHYLSFKDPLDLLGEPKFHIFKRRIQNSGL